ncbi:hypothetical protein FJY71_05525 [candidate division WOR-3 bacterium]|nr:hypothetical protein [candidate division WOR-3 bacterium]
MAPMPAGRTFVQGAWCRGRVYVCCGMTGSGTSNNNCWEYAPATNTWAVKATAPTRQLANAIGVRRDSLIYVIGGYGGGSGSNIVQIYNPFTDSWTSGTAMPECGDMGSACIVGDTIYITNFYNRQAGRLWENGRKGAIDPSNLTEIAWSDMPVRPYACFCAGTAALNGKAYCLGGCTTLYTLSLTRRGWCYDPGSGTIDTILSLPATVGRGVRMLGIVGRGAASELLQIAGQADSGPPPYHRMALSPPGFAQPDSASKRGVTPAPTATIVRGVLFLPEADTRHPDLALLNSAGRRVGDLRPGANDVRQLPAGVYFVRTASGEGRVANSKVVIQR